MKIFLFHTLLSEINVSDEYLKGIYNSWWFIWRLIWRLMYVSHRCFLLTFTRIDFQKFSIQMFTNLLSTYILKSM